MSSTNELTAKEFFKQFKNKIYDPNAVDDGISFKDAYSMSGRYTNIVNKTVVSKILEESGLRFSNEYYRIDVTGWEHVTDEKLKKEFLKAKLNYHSWKLKVAFEHENNYDDWTDEVTKLLYVSCPLKVVVGYNEAGKREDDVCGDKHKLELVARTIKNLNVYVNGELLIILGNCGEGYKKEKEAEKYFGYRAYLYDNGTFKPIEG